MERFIESLDLDQCLMIKMMIDDRYNVLKSMSKRHIKAEFVAMETEELVKLKKKYKMQQDNVRNNKDWDSLQLRINIIDELNCV